MSWKDKLETQYKIQTGDGSVYEPLWFKASKLRDYNVTEYTYIDVRGSFVDRKRERGARYAIEIYFQGDDHLDVSAAFDNSASDSRPWIITHPYYGRLTVQPTSLAYDNNDYNVTKITGQVIETIGGTFPSTSVSPVDTITLGFNAANLSIGNAYANNVTPNATDINQMQQQAIDSYSDGQSSLNTGFGSDYLNALNTAQGLIINATSEPLLAIRSMQALISAPARFQSSVSSRFNTLQSSLTRLLTDAYTTASSKQLFQANGGTIISSMALAASLPQTGDYDNRVDVVNVVERLLGAYNSYIDQIGLLQTDNEGAINSYIPDPDALRSLTSLVNFTLTNLFSIADGAKQQRTETLKYDSNWILLAQRFYGLVSSVDNVVKIMNENNAGLNNILIVRANTPIIYYV